VNVQQLKLEVHKVVTIAPTASLKDLLATLDNCGYQYIPVVAGGKFLGIAGYPDVHRAFFECGCDKEKFLAQTTVAQVAVNKEAVIDEEGNIEEILKRIDRVPFLAVLDPQGNFNGIVTKSALTELIREGLGMHKPGIRVTVSIPEMRGYLEKFSSVVKNYSNIYGLLVLDDHANTGYRRLSFKVSPDANINGLTEDLKNIGVRVFHVAPVA
jgi:CBS domain-containing protein